jgi:hypothetical protein
LRAYVESMFVDNTDLYYWADSPTTGIYFFAKIHEGTHA